MVDRQLFVIICNLFFTAYLFGQVDLIPERFDFEPDLSYSAQIESPVDFLGYELGESFTRYANAVAYFKYLAEHSDRILINTYGETYEGRKLYNLVISSPENLSRIEELRAQNLKLGDPRNISSAVADKIINEKPVFISYSYNIHGNEASSTEAAMQVSYRYAAAQDSGTTNILNNAVLIFYICINPDGRDRFVYWFESVKRSLPATEPAELEHFEPWPGGRTNHYWFDLNRDWIWGVHPESRGHTTEYLKWMPQIHTDYHEQGYNSNYFTVPGTTPRNKLLPDDYESLADTIGKANIKEFNKHRINYFTREAFDFFYPGYGSSYPTVMNAIGMLTEQGGGASRAIETDDGYVLTLRQRIFDHYTTSVTTINKVVSQKELFNRYYYSASNPKNSKSPTKAYILENDGNMYLEEVVNMLLHHGVEVLKNSKSLKLVEATSYRTHKKVNKTIPEDSYIILTDQPKHLFINTILSAQMEIEDSVMYDMATWAAPLAYNLEAYSTDKHLNGIFEPVTLKLNQTGVLENPDATYAYVIEWNQRNAPEALALLWQKGYRVRCAQEPFTNGNQSFGAGSLIVLQGRNLDKIGDWKKDMQEIIEKTPVSIVGLNTGRMVTGNDLASRKSRPLSKPRVALLVDRPFSTYTCGQIYFLFDQETRLPIQRLKASQLIQTAIPKFGGRFRLADLNDFDVLILAGGGQNLSKVFGKNELAKLKEWIRNGGTLIATESAAPFFAKKEKADFSKIKMAPVPKDTSETASLLTYSERTDYMGKKRIPGTALNARIDVTNPLAFGLKKELYTLKFGNTSFLPSIDYQTVGQYSTDPFQLMASGYASEENLKALAGNGFAAVETIGRGKLVLLLDNTHYRMFWRGPSRMMQNAVMLLPSF